MISQRWRYNGRGSVVMRFLTSSPVKCAAARVILAISSPFLLASSPPLFYHSSRFSIRHRKGPRDVVGETGHSSPWWMPKEPESEMLASSWFPLSRCYRGELPHSWQRDHPYGDVRMNKVFPLTSLLKLMPP